MLSEMAAWGSNNLPADNPYKLIGDVLYAHFHQQYAADLLYSMTAPPQLTPLDMAFVLAFQTLERLNDARAAPAR